MDRWFGWLFTWGGGSIQEFGGSRINTRRHLTLFRWHILTINRNEYHDRSDEERAEEYLREWSKCEKELRMFKIAALGEGMDQEVKKVIRDSFGVDFKPTTGISIPSET